jgi:hypothetical protein
MENHSPGNIDRIYFLTLSPILYTVSVLILATNGHLGRCGALPWVISSVTISPLLVLIALAETITLEKKLNKSKYLLIPIQVLFLALCLILLLKH